MKDRSEYRGLHKNPKKQEGGSNAKRHHCQRRDWGVHREEGSSKEEKGVSMEYV